MGISTPTVLKGFSKAGSGLAYLAEVRRRARGEGRALLCELEDNLRYFDLVTEDGVALEEIIQEISAQEFNRLLKNGFNFNSIKKAKIKMPSLDGTNLASWQGKSTEDLIYSIYRKIKDLSVKFRFTKNSKKRRWGVRVINIQKRIWLLSKHIK